ncbi:unnamed protein product [Cyclocybe aegerita]|uniref:Peroxisomal membrane protein PEX14 n=1 Tax=Cyclocybe aegerita TaxID=1973307 RepID=A0A8S0VWR1_CYCAE|nr:unnamed protein product [Cyclocybe aegerita]
MSDETKKEGTASQQLAVTSLQETTQPTGLHSVPAASIPEPQSPPQPVPPSTSRDEIISKARAFLASPQVQYQDVHVKRAFLAEKGLNGAEIESLLHRVPTQLPTIPPRTYPQPPPSNLPLLLLGIARLFSWLAGGSALLIFAYHRFLLPRITHTYLARQSLKGHHLSLLRQLTTSLSALKESQAESFSVLPRPDPFKESKENQNLHSVAELLKSVNEKIPRYDQIPVVTLLRCALEDFGRGKDGEDAKPMTEDLFRYLDGQIPWLLTEEGLEFEQELWDTLSTSTLFSKRSPSSSSEAPGMPSRWEYVRPNAVPSPPLVDSLQALSAQMPKDVNTRKSPFQYTLQALSDFTGYISTQVYLPYRHPNIQGTIEEDIKKEIKSLKGLVLNRRSFMTAIPRAPLPTSSTRTTP